LNHKIKIHMKKIFWTLPALIVFFCTFSCNNVDEDEPSTISYEAIGYVTSNDAKPTFITDYGTTLVSSLAITSDTGDVFQNGQRVFLRFSYADTTNHEANKYSINISEYAQVSVSEIKTVKPDSINPYLNQSLYYVYRMYISGNFFNSILYTYKALTDLDALELVRVMESENNSEGSKFPTLRFELRHDAQAVNSGYYRLRLNSFNLLPLVEEFPQADSLNLRVEWSESSGSGQTYDFIYHPSDPSVTPSVGMVLKSKSGFFVPKF